MLVPGMAGSMSAGYGSGGIRGMAGWLRSWHPKHSRQVRLVVFYAVAATVSIVALVAIKNKAPVIRLGKGSFAALGQYIQKLIKAGRYGFGRLDLLYDFLQPFSDQVVFEQGSGYTSILEENMWMGPGVVFYA